MKTTFNNEEFMKIQQKELLDALNSAPDRVYVEIGGKFFDDFHAERVLSGYRHDNKYNLIKTIPVDKEFILCISAKSITKRKKRRDNKLLYLDECLRMIDLLQKDNFKFSVAITMYKDTPTLKRFINQLEKKNVSTYKQYTIEGYPTNIEMSLGKNGFANNDYIPCNSKMVCVIAPGPNSGKFSACLSQIYHEKQKNMLPIYRKIETFLIPQLPLEHPINLACSVAMADVSSDDVVDERHFKEYGKLMSVDSRDLQAFEILFEMVKEYDKKVKSIIDTFINNIYCCITDMDGAKKHAIKEINKRYKDAVHQYKIGKMSAIEYKEIVRIKNVVDSDRVLSEKEMEVLFTKAINFWGYDIQTHTCVEELAELIQAMSKYNREGKDEAPKELLDNVLEEIADVHNMIEQMEIYFGKEEINRIRAEKAYRTQKILEKEIIEQKIMEGK